MFGPFFFFFFFFSLSLSPLSLSLSHQLVNFVDVDWRDAVSLGMESLMVVQNNVVLFSTMFFGACIGEREREDAVV